MSLISVFSPNHNVIFNFPQDKTYLIEIKEDEDHFFRIIAEDEKCKYYIYDKFKSLKDAVNVLRYINIGLVNNLNIQIEIDIFDKISVKVGVDKYEINFKND